MAFTPGRRAPADTVPYPIRGFAGSGAAAVARAAVAMVFRYRRRTVADRGGDGDVRQCFLAAPGRSRGRDVAPDGAGVADLRCPWPSGLVRGAIAIHSAYLPAAGSGLPDAARLRSD